MVVCAEVDHPLLSADQSHNVRARYFFLRTLTCHLGSLDDYNRAIFEYIMNGRIHGGRPFPIRRYRHMDPGLM